MTRLYVPGPLCNNEYLNNESSERSSLSLKSDHIGEMALQQTLFKCRFVYLNLFRLESLQSKKEKSGTAVCKLCGRQVLFKNVL